MLVLLHALYGKAALTVGVVSLSQVDMAVSAGGSRQVRQVQGRSYRPKISALMSLWVKSSSQQPFNVHT